MAVSISRNEHFRWATSMCATVVCCRDSRSWLEDRFDQLRRDIAQLRQSRADVHHMVRAVVVLCLNDMLLCQPNRPARLLIKSSGDE